MTTTMDDIFGTSGVLARHLAGYEPRPGQQEMAEAVAAAFADPEQATRLVVEAETGLGKTLAYLVPAVLSGRRVVVSTNTRNLQDQILQREIPFIQQYIDPALQALCVKGRQNYLCVYRWHQHVAAGQSRLFEEDGTRENRRLAGKNHLWRPLGNELACRKLRALAEDLLPAPFLPGQRLPGRGFLLFEPVAPGCGKEFPLDRQSPPAVF